MLRWNLIHPLLKRASEHWETPLDIVDRKGIVLVSSEIGRVDTVINEKGTNYLPICRKEEFVGWLSWEGHERKEAVTMLKVAIEEVLALEEKPNHYITTPNEEDLLVNALLERDAVSQEKNLKVWGMALGYDLNLPRSVILISFEPKENIYFNINLQLGYDVTKEHIKEELRRKVKDGLHITTQDIIAFVDIDNMFFEFLVKALPERLTGRYLEPLFKKLSSGREENMQLIKTLETYIDTNMNIRTTAEKLYMHRNTVSKHLEKIKGLTGLDPRGCFFNIFWLKMLVIYTKMMSLKAAGESNVIK
ncbi:MAG: helix-turn-helix domain-containing protein [Bacillota bacterium]